MTHSVFTIDYICGWKEAIAITFVATWRVHQEATNSYQDDQKISPELLNKVLSTNSTHFNIPKRCLMAPCLWIWTINDVANYVAIAAKMVTHRHTEQLL